MATTTARETTRLFTRPLGVGGVQEDIGIAGVAERSRAERFDLFVHRRADPRHLGLRDPGLDAERLDEVIDLPRRDAVDFKPSITTA
jgi:hypothetical protein